MKRTCVAISCLCFIAVYATGCLAQSKTVESEIIRLERENEQAFNTLDLSWMQQHYADDYVCIYVGGEVLNKKQDIEMTKKAKAKNSKPMHWEARELKVHAHGTTAISTGTYVNVDKPSERFRYLDVWIQNNGLWQIAGCAGTAITAASSGDTKP